jgi:spoIIIJ-associated protein
VSADDENIDIRIEGENLGMLIGRRGETLNAIQHITNYIVNRGEEGRVRVVVDVENYRKKREESLQKLAEKTASKVLKYRRNIALEPMNAYERHIIHSALQEWSDISTFSSGAEPRRCVVISYTPGGVKPQKPESTQRPRPQKA